ncbi:transmembrane amino acid transporter family protein [Actinidia rufa]|uniref:Transmembrane amino acid transporter family protein n=1 Tax=Actinidia rufa TaxID=165716 RepID=A0A7J0FZC7_9ERIC|nr:transmembrane amino acid transporter family protein [Actinidia rufa]
MEDVQDERSAKAKELNDWLSVTSSRNAKWWYSAFHNITAMVGAGVLGLPYAMSQLGWGPGVTIVTLSWIITLYTLWQLVEMHEKVPGKRFDRYHELGQHAFGEKLGLWIVVPQQLMVEVGVNIVYMITGGKSLKKFHDTVCPVKCYEIKTTYFIMMFAGVQFVISHLPSYNSVAGISLTAAIMSLCYSTIAWVASLHKGVQPGIQYTPRASTGTGTVFQFLSALGDVAFAFAGHNVVLEIQATIPSEPGKPSKKAMWKGVVVAYIVVALCYFPVSFICYWVFGNTVEDNILQSLERPAWLIASANMFVVVHVIGSYQVFAQPVFDMVEAFMVMKMNFKPTKTLRFIVRNIYVALTMFVGMTFPFFGGLLSFFGGFAFAPTSYYLPCIIWLIICKPKRFSLSWCTNWICIILGVLVMVLAPIGALRQIVLQAKDFQFYS